MRSNILVVLVILQCLAVSTWLVMNVEEIGRAIVIPSLLTEGIVSWWLIGKTAP